MMTTSTVSQLWNPFGGGSHKRGITSFMKGCECGRKVALDRAAAKSGQPTSMSTGPVLVGSALHELLHRYYGKMPFEFEVNRDLPIEAQTALHKAWEIFRWYRTQYKSTEFGKPVELEVSHPINKREENVLRAIDPDFSCRFDMIIKPSERVCDRLIHARGIFLQPEHYYIVDHKSTGYVSKWKAKTYRYNIQFAAYAWAFKLLWPKREFGGVLVNCISTGTTRTAVTFLVEDLAQEDFECVSRVIRTARANEDEPNPAACCFPNLCPWLGNGCKRYE